MGMISFAGSYHIDPSVARARGAGEVNRLTTAAEKNLHILDGIDVDVAFNAKNPTDFEISQTFWAEGRVEHPDESTKSRHYVYRQMPLNIFTPILSTFGIVMSAFIETKDSLKNGKADFSGTKLIAKSFNPKRYTTESLEAFVERAFRQIRQDIETPSETPRAE